MFTSIVSLTRRHHAPITAIARGSPVRHVVQRLPAGGNRFDYAVPKAPPDTPFGRQLGRARVAARLPAVAGALVTLEGSPVAHAFGVRRMNANDLVTDDDHFHLGSNSKAITATLIGALVEDSVLRWDQTIGASFPELAASMPAAWRTVTLRQLFTHRAGVAEFTSPDEILGMPQETRRGTGTS